MLQDGEEKSRSGSKNMLCKYRVLAMDFGVSQGPSVVSVPWASTTLSGCNYISCTQCCRAALLSSTTCA